MKKKKKPIATTDKKLRVVKEIVRSQLQSVAGACDVSCDGSDQCGGRPTVKMQLY